MVEKTIRPTIRKPISWMDLWQEIQWTACLGETYHSQAKYFYESECDESEKFLFVASDGWVNNFMRRNGFSLRRKTTAA